MQLSCLTQKIELDHLIPAIRLEFIRILGKDISDAEISRKLGVTKSAISQYKHKKRGKNINFPKKIEKEIEKSASLILKGKNADSETNKIINLMKSSREICCLCEGCGCKK